MEKVIYSKKGGSGIILSSDEFESDFIVPKNFIIDGKELITNTQTDLFGLFSEPVRYAGELKDNPKYMCFFLGKNQNDLFDLSTYYSCFYWINENLLANKYSNRTVKTFRIINGKLITK